MSNKISIESIIGGSSSVSQEDRSTQNTEVSGFSLTGTQGGGGIQPPQKLPSGMPSNASTLMSGSSHSYMSPYNMQNISSPITGMPMTNFLQQGLRDPSMYYGVPGVPMSSLLSGSTPGQGSSGSHSAKVLSGGSSGTNPFLSQVTPTTNSNGSSSASVSSGSKASTLTGNSGSTLNIANLTTPTSAAPMKLPEPSQDSKPGEETPVVEESNFLEDLESPEKINEALSRIEEGSHPLLIKAVRKFKETRENAIKSITKWKEYQHSSVDKQADYLIQQSRNDYNENVKEEKKRLKKIFENRKRKLEESNDTRRRSKRKNKRRKTEQDEEEEKSSIPPRYVDFSSVERLSIQEINEDLFVIQQGITSI